MATLLTESQMMQRVEFEEWGINFINEHKELYEALEAKILVENIRLEKYHREYKFLIDDLFPEEMLNESEILNEGMLTDIGIGLGSMIPGIGSAVAAGGTVYYLTRAYKAKGKGDTLTMYMELLSSFLTAGQIIPVIGSIVSSVGKIIAAPFKLLFSGIKSFGSFIVKLLGKGSVEGAEATIKAIAPQAGKLANIPGASAAAKASGKIAGYMDDFIKFFSAGGTGASILKKIGIDTAEFIKFCGTVKNMLGGFAKFIPKIAGKEGDDLTKAVIQNIDDVANPAAVAGIIDGQADDALKLLKSQADEAAEAVAKGEAGLAAQRGARETARGAEGALKAGKKALTKEMEVIAKAESGSAVNKAMRNLVDEVGPDDIKAAFKGQKFKMGNVDKRLLDDIIGSQGARGTKQADAIRALFGKESFAVTTVSGKGSNLFVHVKSSSGKVVKLTTNNFTKLVDDPAVLKQALEGMPAYQKMLGEIAESKAMREQMKVAYNALEAQVKANKGLVAKYGDDIAKMEADIAKKAAAQVAKNPPKVPPEVVTEISEELTQNPGVLKGLFDTFMKTAFNDKNASRNLVVLTYAAAGGVAKDELGEEYTPQDLDPEAQAWMDGLNFAEDEEAGIDLGSEEDLQEARYLADLIWESKTRNSMIKQQKLINLIS